MRYKQLMNAARNTISPPTGDAPGRTDAKPQDLRSIDWHSLRSRLFSACDRLGVLGEDAQASHLRLRGSFAGAAASQLDTFGEASRNINPDASSNGKPKGDKDSSVADANDSGERG